MSVSSADMYAAVRLFAESRIGADSKRDLITVRQNLQSVL